MTRNPDLSSLTPPPHTHTHKCLFSMTSVITRKEYSTTDLKTNTFSPAVVSSYGCGYGESDTKFPTDFSDLDYVVAELHKRGFYTGLWSSTGLPNISREVAGSGVRIGKTDVGWIGAGCACMLPTPISSKCVLLYQNGQIGRIPALPTSPILHEDIRHIAHLT